MARGFLIRTCRFPEFGAFGWQLQSGSMLCCVHVLHEAFCRTGSVSHREPKAWDIQCSGFVPGRRKVALSLADLDIQFWTVCNGFLSPVSGTLILQQVCIWHSILIFTSVLTVSWCTCTAQELIFKKYIWVFFPLSCILLSWQMRICIEIILRELSLQGCQIHERHYCKDMVLGMDSPYLGLFLLSFIMSGSPHTAFVLLGCCFWVIYFPKWCSYILKHITVFYFFFNIRISK